METGSMMFFEETKAHGDALFPFNIYPCTIPDDFPSVALHWHRYMEIIFVKSGAMAGRLAMQNINLDGGDICIVPPGTLHGLQAQAGCRAEYENIIFDVEMLCSGAADICTRQYLHPLAAGRLLHPQTLHPSGAGYAQAAACLKRAEELCGARNPGYELGVKAAMMDLIFQLMQLQPCMPEVEIPGTARLKQVLACIRRDYAQPLRVEDVAREAGCSPSHFMRWFRRMTGSSFVSFLNDYRLMEAARQLCATDEKVLAIAQNVGFESLSNFNRQFKLRYAMTPREYRLGK